MIIIQIDLAFDQPLRPDQEQVVAQHVIQKLIAGDLSFGISLPLKALQIKHNDRTVATVREKTLIQGEDDGRKRT